MRLATTTEDFLPYFEDNKDRIKHVVKAGFKYIDLSMYIPIKDDPLLIRDDWRKNAKELKAFTEDLGAKLIQAHSPGGLMFSEDGVRNDELFKRAVRSIEVCGALGISNIVVHASLSHGITKEEYFERNLKFYNSLIPVMEDSNVNVLIENDSSDELRTGYAITSGKDMLEFISYVNHPLFHGCWDTGHANTLGTQYEHLMALGKDLYALHVNDNCGSQDEHTMPYLGTLNLDDLINGLLDSGYNGYFTFESCRLLRPSRTWFGSRHTFSKDTRLLDPTLQMHTKMEELLYEIGVHALKSYNCFEE